MERIALQLNHPPDTAAEEAKSVAALAQGRRISAKTPDGSVILDRVGDGDANCRFGTISASEHVREISFWVDGQYRVEMPAAGGWLLLPVDPERRPIWIPCAPTQRVLESHDRIMREKIPAVMAFQSGADRTSITFALDCGMHLDWVAWQLPLGMQDELAQLSQIERQPIQLWGSHTLFRRPADLYIHLIQGRVYENRYSWPFNRRICSENDAHALYVALSGLERRTGKALYRSLKIQVVLSVLARQSDDGSWRHGEWTGHMESHFRLHCSAMHLLLDYLAEERDEAVVPALERAAAFISQQHDRLECGAWFLHDELEKSIEGMAEAPFHYLKSHAFGKSESNMLVLNTQLDTFIALHRYGELTGDGQYSELLSSAVGATRTVLSARPADWLYRPLFKAIELTLLPTQIAERLPVHVRVLKRIAWKYLTGLLPRIKRHYPRLVFPDGYIDRELSLDIFAHVYLSINLMDLLRYYRRTRDELVLQVALDGIRFGQRLRIWERWQESRGQAYGSGFWEEALYHLCLLRPNLQYREWLYKAVLFLEDNGHGVSPSILGTNCEAIPRKEQVRAPLFDHPKVRTVNLSTGGRREFLFINPGNERVDLTTTDISGIEDLLWSVAPFNEPPCQKPEFIPPLGCIRAADRSAAAAE